MGVPDALGVPDVPQYSADEPQNPYEEQQSPYPEPTQVTVELQVPSVETLALFCKPGAASTPVTAPSNKAVRNLALCIFCEELIDVIQRE